MGALRPQIPHRSPRQAFGGNWECAALGAWTKKTRTRLLPAGRFLRVWTRMSFREGPGIGQWVEVVKSEMDVAGRELKIWLDFESGSQFACPRCGAFCPVHDTVEKKWRHLDFWQHRTELIARVPRIHFQEHGILQAAVPWARPGSGFTLMMEAMILPLG